MAPQFQNDGDIEDPSTSIDQAIQTPEEESPTPVPYSFPKKPWPQKPSPTDLTMSSNGPEDDDPRTRGPSDFFEGRPHWTSNYSRDSQPKTTVSSDDTQSKATSASEESHTMVTSAVVATGDATSPYFTTPAGSHGRRPPQWLGTKEKMNNGTILVASIIPAVVLLAILGALLFFCTRKRKRQQAVVASHQKKAQEMSMHQPPQSTTRAYMASPPVASPQYTESQDQHPMSIPAPLAPIIIGPIHSANNGAYFTGMDTSDAISMTSASNVRSGPSNPFADNDSLVEPPPPYRPRSAAPPSLTNSSRQSSLRASRDPLTTSRTHLIDRSPFEDPTDDDAVSEISGPIARRDHDAMSAVSDLSYQNDPVVNRSSF